MTIEIHRPELEAFIQDRMLRGQDIEEILMRAFQLSSPDRVDSRPNWRVMRGMARGGAESLTQALMRERAAGNAHDEARIQRQNH